MAKGRSSRDDRPLGRRNPTREPISRILIVCEGKVTEADYWDEFRLWVKNPAVKVKIDGRGGDPKALVERAHRQWEDGRFDEVWCVLDVDEHPDLIKVQEEARRHGIRLAISNPCFELWALLHFQDHGAHVTCKELSRRVEHHVGDYHKKLPFAKLILGYDDAVRRAETLERRHEADGTTGANPSTDVHHLTKRIRQFGREERLSGR